MRPGRTCPTDYRLSPQIFAATPVLHCQTLYVAGGIYGNQWALQALDKTIAWEKTEVGASILAIYNGDLHWFDATSDSFAAVEELANGQGKLPLIGNVEAELVRKTDIGAGCGCAYPESVAQEVVDRSNLIHQQLKRAFEIATPKTQALLQNRPAACTVNVSGYKVGVTHGDEQSLGGWRCAREDLARPARQKELTQWMKSQAIDVLATSHTCAPAAFANDEIAIINNGAAGMPNFATGQFGLATRIATTPHPEALYRARIGRLFVEAVPLRYSQQEFTTWFDQTWPTGSAAATSYRPRIAGSISDTPTKAILAGFELTETYIQRGISSSRQIPRHSPL